MTSEYRRLASTRACLVPLLISVAFAAGYLVGVRSPVDRSEIGVNGKSPLGQVGDLERLRGGGGQDPKSVVPVQSPSEPVPVLGQDTVNAAPVNVIAEGLRKTATAQPLSGAPGRVAGAPVGNQVAAGGAARTVTQRVAVAPAIPTVKPGRQSLDYEMVVSHYNEPLDWLKPYAGHGHVYHKGSDRGPPFQMYKWERLPNVGREAHTYLHHIINNYNNLADVTVFLQGHGTSHDQSWCYSPMEFVTNAKSNNFCKRQGTFNGWGRIHHFGKWLADLSTGRMRQAKMTVGDFYAALFGTQPPPSVARCLAGCFSATRDNLRRHPLSFYQKAIEFVNDHSNPEEAHYFERLWSAIIYA